MVMVDPDGTRRGPVTSITSAAGSQGAFGFAVVAGALDAGLLAGAELVAGLLVEAGVAADVSGLDGVDEVAAVLVAAVLPDVALLEAAGALVESVWVLVSGCEAGASDVAGVPVVESSPDPNIIEIAQANRATTTMPAATTMPRRIQ